MTSIFQNHELETLTASAKELLLQAAMADGFSPDLSSFSTRLTNYSFGQPFKKKTIILEGTLIDFSQREELEQYEKALFAKLNGQLTLDESDLCVSYYMDDTYNGITIRLKILSYMRHPADYIEALVNANALHMSSVSTTTIQCGV